MARSISISCGSVPQAGSGSYQMFGFCVTGSGSYGVRNIRKQSGRRLLHRIVGLCDDDLCAARWVYLLVLWCCLVVIRG
jgi:hypothetical protein